MGGKGGKKEHPHLEFFNSLMDAFLKKKIQMEECAFGGINTTLCKSAEVTYICQMSLYPSNLKYCIAISAVTFDRTSQKQVR